MRRWVVAMGLGCAVAVDGGRALGDESFDIVTSTSNGNAVEWRIERPNVKAPSTAYPQIALRSGDLVTIDAGGCVQTGGHGKTWKRYVDPVGSNADEQYSGLVEIPGTTPGMQRLQPWLRKSLAITRSTTLTLGYKDDNYGDNGYSGHDDGDENQCKDVGPAWVTVRVEHGAAPPQAVLPRYNEVFQKSSHNAFEPPKPSLQTQLEANKIRSLELDIHHSRLGVGAPADDFFVYHHAVFAPGSSCATLSICLAQLKAWHDRHPQHEVTTIFLDLKDPWIPSHSEASIDSRFKTLLSGLVFTPAALVAACPTTSTLRTALKSCGWPTTDALRGKFLIVITGEDGPLDAYAGPPAHAATMQSFIAPEIQADGDIANHENAVFFNLNSDHFTTGRAIYAAGFVSRVYYSNLGIDVHGINDANNWQIATNNQIHHIATDVVNPQDGPFAVTHNARGWPFSCMFRDCSALAEP